jgi:hypothetical protein
MGRDTHRFTGGHFFTFGDWLHIGVRKVRVRIPFVETRKRKVVKSVVPTRPANQTHPSNPTKPTSQNKTVGPRVGEESTKAQAS